MHKVELAQGVLSVQLAVPLERLSPVRASFDHGYLVQLPAITLGVGLQRIYDKPLIRILFANLSPTHGNLLS